MIKKFLNFMRDIFMRNYSEIDAAIKSHESREEFNMNTRKMREMHYTLIDERDWPWQYFTPKEIASKGDGLILIDFDAMDKLEEFRDILKVPFTPNSAYRSEAHNKDVGGTKNSMHLQGKAFDIPIKGKMTRERIKTVAEHVGFTGFGDYDTFVHIDTGRKRYWDMRTKDV